MTDTTTPPMIVHSDDVEELSQFHNARWGAHFKPLTPSMRPRGGTLGVNQMRVPPGKSGVPFHTHLREDEVFYILAGTGTLRYGETFTAVRAGDCVSCPAGSGVAHQLINTSDADLVYLAIGPRDPHEVCTYPDSGKVLVRGLGQVGVLEDRAYMDGEDDLAPAVDAYIDGAR